MPSHTSATPPGHTPPLKPQPRVESASSAGLPSTDAVTREQAILQTTTSAKTIVGAFAMPVLFVLFMAATLVTAFHNPKPNDLRVTLVGTPSVTTPIAQQLDASAPGAFDITTTADTDRARELVATRASTGAIVVQAAGTPPDPESPTTDGSETDSQARVTIYTAAAGGRGPAGAVAALGDQVAAQLNVTAQLEEVAPLAPQDPLGNGLFYVLIYTTVGAFLAPVVLTQLHPTASLRFKYAVGVVAAALIPITVLGLASVFLDGFEMNFGQLVSYLTVTGLYVFTVTLVVIVSDQLLKKAALLVMVPVTVFINFAAAGGGSPVSMLPDFWQWVHSFWFGAGALEAVRDIVYFPDADPTRWIVQMLVWTAALLVGSLLIEARGAIKGLRAALDTQHHTIGAGAGSPAIAGRHDKASSDTRNGIGDSPDAVVHAAPGVQDVPSASTQSR